MNVADVDRFFPNYSRAVESLKRAFVTNRGMPLALSEPNRCYASTTATALLALHRIGALDDGLRAEFQQTLMRLRTKRGGSWLSATGPAWDAQEGPSVWSTSNALWALASTGYSRQPLQDSVKWVVNAYGHTPGFGPQRTDANLFISAYAAQGLRVAGDPAATSAIRRELVDWVCKTELKNGGWPAPYATANAPDPTATLCALWILRDNGDQEANKHQIERGLTYLRDALKGSPGIWQMNGVPPVYIHKDDTGHTSMSIDSFTPSFVIPLIRMGVDPYDPLVLEPIRWLQRHAIQDGSKAFGWDNVERNPTSVKSHATAFALWAIHNWAVAVARTARAEVEHEKSITIFIVHGRNEQALKSLQEQLATWEAPPREVVKDETYSLDTIFSRVTHAARLCNYAIILATPDDRGYLAGEPQSVGKRARQNVILELGLFLGLLGNRRMVMLTRCDANDDLELPSDLGGVIRIDMEQPDWTTQLKRCLKDAGVLG